MIKRYVASADTTITNGFQLGNKKRGVDSNMGAADSLELYVAYNAATSDSREESRILLKFPIEDLILDRMHEMLAPAGAVRFFLRLFNVVHPETAPRRLSVQVFPLIKDWEEGDGMDLDNYTDPGSGAGGTGATWKTAQKDVLWDTEGGDVGTQFVATYLEKGSEDILLDVTDFVESWMVSPLENYGLSVMIEDTELTSKYTKKVSSRTSEFWFKRPILEARWDSSINDKRNNFSPYSAFNDPSENISTIYFYNYRSGALRDLPTGIGSVVVDIYEDEEKTLPVATNLNTFRATKGIYGVNVNLQTSSSKLYDVWRVGTSILFTGTISVEQEIFNPNLTGYVIKSKNKASYCSNEKAKIRVFVRSKNRNLNIFTKSQIEAQIDHVENIHFKIVRLSDMSVVINYDTTYNSTLLSSDPSGNYFDFDMQTLQPDYGYGICFGHFSGGYFVEFPEVFKFRVKKNTVDPESRTKEKLNFENELESELEAIL